MRPAERKMRGENRDERTREQSAESFYAGEQDQQTDDCGLFLAPEGVTFRNFKQTASVNSNSKKSDLSRRWIR